MIIDKIKEDVATFMKSKEKDNVTTLRGVLSEIENFRIRRGFKDTSELSENDILLVIQRSIKVVNQELEYLNEYDKNTDKQEAEKELLESYLPKQMTEDEILELVNIAIINIKNSSTELKLGTVIKAISADVMNKADMRYVAKVVGQQIQKHEGEQ